MVKIIKCLEKNGCWEFYCEYCRRPHRHGMIEGMRASHCNNPKSPIYRVDYYIKLEDGDDESAIN